MSDELQEKLIVGDVEVTKEEARQHMYVGWVDFFGMAVFVAWYFALALLSAQDVDMSEAEATPVAVIVLQAMMAFVALMVLFYHTQSWPVKKEDDIFHAMKYIGRWLFLTRHCLALQAVHLVVTFYAMVNNDEYLHRLTYGSCYLHGSMGCFVTVQYFLLVHNNPEFVEKCETMKSKRAVFGLVNFRGYNAMNHIPALFLAVFDVLVAKRHDLMQLGAVSLPISLGMVFFYVVFYLALIWCNFYATGYFPYAVLRELKTAGKWLAFLFVQTILINVFLMCLFGLVFVPQRWFSS